MFVSAAPAPPGAQLQAPRAVRTIAVACPVPSGSAERTAVEILRSRPRLALGIRPAFFGARIAAASFLGRRSWPRAPCSPALAASRPAVAESAAEPARAEDAEAEPCSEQDLSTFEGLGVHASLLEGLRSRGIDAPVEVQQAAVPAALAGEDVIIQSHTGTGKTLAYVLPLLTALLEAGPPAPGKKGATGPEVLVISPTRELSMQICLEIEGVAGGLLSVQQLIGGANPERQVDKLKKRKPRVVVGTPGRLRELVDSGKLKCSNLRAVVVDEVDHLLSDAFARDLGHLLRTANANRRQTLFVSATVPPPVLDLAANHMRDPLHIQVDATKLVAPSLDHCYIVCPPRKKAETLRRLFVAAAPSCALTFINDPRRINELAEYLSSNGTVSVAVLHGEADKEERGNVLAAVRRGKVPLLVCTEVAARGLDLPHVSHVFNLDLPTDHLHYLHRAGRTGRLKQGSGRGTVVTIVTPDEQFVIEKLERSLDVQFRRVEVYAGKLFDALPGES